MELHPTHTCFDDTAEYLKHILLEDEQGLRSGVYTVCHGILEADDGDKYSHSWVEHDGFCVDAKIYEGERVYVEYPIDHFYKMVVEYTRYTIWEVLELDRKHGYCGPWEEKYKKLCGTSKKKFSTAASIYNS